MRLLHTKDFTLKTFFGQRLPHYAILSHTWRSNDREEILFEDIQKGREAWDAKPTSVKLLGFCELAAKECYEWVWIDTCCIDKSSSAELSEAINSMYQWYQRSDVCYVYLEDLDSTSISPSNLEDFKNSRWFTRGWTLQELLAPETVEFYDKNWKEIGTKSSLQIYITEVAGIRREVLLHPNTIQDCTIAERMSWASNRNTTRDEDIAYCLLGIFNIHMPLLYGEGDRAFMRLQEEILKISDDYSLLAWARVVKSHYSIFALSPEFFSVGNNKSMCSWTFYNHENDRGPDFYQRFSQRLASTSQLTVPWSYSRLKRVREIDLRTENSYIRSISFTNKQPTLDEFSRLTPKGLRLTLPTLLHESYNGLLVYLGLVLEPGGELVCLALNRNNPRTRNNFGNERPYFDRAIEGLVFLPKRDVIFDYQTIYLKTGLSQNIIIDSPPMPVTFQWQSVMLIFAGHENVSLGIFRYFSEKKPADSCHLFLRYGVVVFRLLLGSSPHPWCYTTTHDASPTPSWEGNQYRTFMKNHVAGQKKDRAELEVQGIKFSCAIKKRNMDWRRFQLEAHRFPSEKEPIIKNCSVLHSVHISAIPEAKDTQFEILHQESLKETQE